jgi:hypothetical protein
LYEEKQSEIDQAYSLAYDAAVKNLNLALSKLPPAIASKLNALKQKAQ